MSSIFVSTQGLATAKTWFSDSQSGRRAERAPDFPAKWCEERRLVEQQVVQGGARALRAFLDANPAFAADLRQYEAGAFPTGDPKYSPKPLLVLWAQHGSDCAVAHVLLSLNPALVWQEESKSKGHSGYTEFSILHVAIIAGNWKAFQFLLQHFPALRDITVKKNEYVEEGPDVWFMASPLGLAHARKEYRMGHSLKAAGANPDETCEDGWEEKTPDEGGYKVALPAKRFVFKVFPKLLEELAA